MTERILLSVFFFCLVTCASMVLIAIWLGHDNMLGETYFKTVATLFIIGLASFITWFTMTLLGMRSELKSQ
jgi:hypothetical protein